MKKNLQALAVIGIVALIFAMRISAWNTCRAEGSIWHCLQVIAPG